MRWWRARCARRGYGRRRKCSRHGRNSREEGCYQSAGFVGDARLFGIIQAVTPDGVARPQQADEDRARRKLKESFPVGQVRDAIGAVDIESVGSDQNILALNVASELGLVEALVVADIGALIDGDLSGQAPAR